MKTQTMKGGKMKEETNKEFLKRFKSNFTKTLNKIARGEGYGRGHKQMFEENKEWIEEKELCRGDKK